MSKLIIERRSEWANRGRKIGLYLNGKKIGTIENGETKEFEVQPGEYSLTAKIDWCGSQNHFLALEENEIKALELTGFPKRKWILPILLLVHLALLGLSHVIEINQSLILTFSLVLLGYILYPITFGRNHYLKLFER